MIHNGSFIFLFVQQYKVTIFLIFVISIMSRRGWSQKQDDAVKQLVQKLGTKNWSAVASQLSHHYKFKERTGKQCRQRYHNHLDPKISKRNWTSQQQQILFKMHKVCGNKWTSIAQHLSGRTDNTIKNHFYSTIRRSLRRMSKLIGSKNSTKQMKYIKPSTLSKIFAINTNPTSIQQIQQQMKKCQQNYAYRQLVDYINAQCTDLTDIILEFSNYKPKGKNIHNLVEKQQKQKYQKVLDKMEKLNVIYQKMRKQQKRINAAFCMKIDDESSQNSQDQSIIKHSNNMDIEKDSSSQSIQHIKMPSTTRSKRQIKPPKKFCTQSLLSSSLKSIQNNTSPSKRQKKSIVLKKNSILIKQLQQKDNRQKIVQNSNGMWSSQQHQKHQKIQLMKKESDRVASNLEIFQKQPDFQINFKDYNGGNGDGNEFPFQTFHMGPTPLSYTPNYFFNTPALRFQSPIGGISGASQNNNQNIFSHIGNMWNVKHGELDDIANSLTSQIATNIALSSAVGSQLAENKEDGKTNSSSNINCSPNSAFKSCQ